MELTFPHRKPIDKLQGDPSPGPGKENAEERIIERMLKQSSHTSVSRKEISFRFVNTHPINPGSVCAVLAAIVVALSSPSRQGPEPTYAEIKNYVLYAYNKESEVIWKKAVPGLPDWRSTTPFDPERSYPKRFLSV